MKKRITALFLMFAMIVCQFAYMPAFAESGRNAYGNTVTYKPVTQLYTGGETIKLFDSQISSWAEIKSDKITQNEAESIKWLSENNYLLNHFGRNYNPKVDLSGCFNSRGEWQTQFKGPTNVGKWYANVRFDKLADKEHRENGNISSIYDKGDLQYFFSWKVKTVQTRWGLTGKSNDTGDTLAFGEWTKSSGGGWKKYNTIGGGPNLGNLSAWKPGKKLEYIGFVAKSDKDSQVDSYLSGAMLVGRDIKGPKISSVDVTADADGTKKIENGAITLDTVDKLKNRTVYFRVQWDEPVVFDNMSQSDIENLSLKVETIGIDATSGIIAEAPFLKFEPSKTDAKPVMVFEYQIPDPYTNSSSIVQERGYFYSFKSVTVSEKENEDLWNNIYDISGNKFASDENGQQPAGKVVTPVSNSAYVDLMPFGIKSIRMTKDSADNDAFVKSGELLGVTLELNKELDESVKTEDLPVLTLNIKDSNGSYVNITPSEDDIARKIKFGDDWIENGYFYKDYYRLKPVMLSDDRKSITYYVQLYPEYKMDGKTIKVKSVSSDKEKVKDESGYSFMNYALENDMLSPTDIPSAAESKKSQYSASPDKQYKFDFEAPQVDLSVNDIGGGIISLTAVAADNSLTGCETVFTVNVNGTAKEEGISYQSSPSENYKESEWIKSDSGALTSVFGAPVTESGEKYKAYGFIKLPKNCEADKMTVSAVVVDEAQNSASVRKDFTSPGDWNGYDTLAPDINLSVKQEEITVKITDMDDEVEYNYGFSNDENTEPSYINVKGKEGIIPAPVLPDENDIFTRVLWIKANDSHGNESKLTKLSVKYDRRSTEIIITDADTEKQYLEGDEPYVGFNIKNAVAYWYMWAEKPANVSDTAAYISEKCLGDMKLRAQEANSVYRSSDNTEKDFMLRIAQLESFLPVASIDSKTESYADNVLPSETSRPIMLVLAAESGDGNTVVKTIEFDTFYGAPRAGLIQSRFSTNNSAGKRIDYIRNSKKMPLLLSNDTDKYAYPLNTPSLYGFAQSEFSLAGDPVTGLDRVDIDKCTVSFEKVIYSGADLSGDVKTRQTLGEWSFSELGLKNDGDSAVIDVDSKSVDAKHYEYDDDGNAYAVRYEFVCNMSYKSKIAASKNPIAYFAFNNNPNAFIEDTQYSKDGNSTITSFNGYEKKNVEAVFDKAGNDITPDIPLYTTAVYSVGSDPGFYLRFSADTPSSNDADKAYYGAPSINESDDETTSKMVMHIGTDAKNLSETIGFSYRNYQGVVSDCYDIAEYVNGNEDELLETKLYYSFEFPERGEASPVYVLKIRRDNTAPIADISVSETERKTNEVLVKVNKVYDVQTSSDGTIVIDTPEKDIERFFEAWREVSEDDDLSAIPFEDIKDEGKTYVRIYPDDDGIYHFTGNGYLEVFVKDSAGNRCENALINGELVNIETEGGDYVRYYVDNVLTSVPKFVSLPKFEEYDGKFAFSAKADETVKNVYLKFDDEYSKLISDDTADGGEVIYGIENIPGMMSGGFDSDSGEINAEIYVKYSQSVPLSSVTLVIENITGRKNEYTYNFGSEIYGMSAQIKNRQNENGYPVYGYEDTLDFTVPVKINGTEGEYSLSHNNLAIYSDGITQISYTDLFGESKTENVYSDIFGAAFAHDLKFISNGNEIEPGTKVQTEKVIIDTSKTKDLSVVGENEFTFDKNGILSYSLKNSKLNDTKKFSVPITNIDTTPPEAIVSIYTDSKRDIDTNEQYIYSITYSIEGFSEDGVTLISSKEEIAPSSVTFDSNSENKEYTFRFCDEAGNEGSYTADVSKIVFSERGDNIITDYRLTYMVSDQNGFRTIGKFTSADDINLAAVNKAVTVKAEALNKDGEAVSATVLRNGNLPSGTALYEKEKLIVFTLESTEKRVVNLTLKGTENSIDASVILPENTIDLTAPKGTVNYEFDQNTVKAYLVTDDNDLAETGIYLTGTKNDGTAFELKKDEKGYYTVLNANGTGSFVLIDKAGNVGNVKIAVFTIDNEAPKVVAEGWQSILDAKTREEIEKLLKTPTNSSIKLFMTFNEMLGKAEVEAYDSEGGQKKVPTEEYVTASVSGSTLTVEFKKNCSAKLTVYDLRGNAYSLWRPDDGPITVIDKDVPKLLENPKRVIDNNKVVLEYIFADNEEVMLLQESKNGYKNKHIVTFSENGAMTLNFADRAGNVFTHYPVITEIDNLAPDIKMSFEYVGEGNELSGNDSYMAGNMYTNKNVRILLNITDDTSEDIEVKAISKTKSGSQLTVNAENITSNGKTYNYNFTVSQNGAYQIIATDKWGNEAVVETSISVIDKTAPAIKFNKNAVVVKTGASVEEIKEEILKNTTATDLQSGANNPMGDKEIDFTKPVVVEVNVDDLNRINRDKDGKYGVKVSARDRLGNLSEKECTVMVLNDAYTFNVNGSVVYANDVFTAPKGRIKIQDASESAKYYYARGHKTMAQMKYAKGFDANEGFDALQNGYYTILVQEEGRKMYILYVYVN